MQNVKNRRFKQLLIRTFAVIFSVIPPSIATVLYFPIWRDRGSDTILSGFALLLLLISAVPLFKLVKRQLESPTAYGIWFAIFVLFFILSKIADEMCVISFTGFLGNVISAVLWKAGERYERKV